MTLVNFCYANDWVGRLVQLRQLVQGVRHWQICHVQLLLHDGIYSYDFNGASLGGIYDFEAGVMLAFQLSPEEEALVSRRAKYFHYSWGDNGPANVLLGIDCVGFVTYALTGSRSGLAGKTLLPGELFSHLYELAHNENGPTIPTANRRKGGPRTPNNSAASSPDKRYPFKEHN